MVKALPSSEYFCLVFLYCSNVGLLLYYQYIHFYLLLNRKLAEELFGSGTGISDNDLRRLIDAKVTSNGATYQALEETITNLKNTLSAVLDAKKQLVSGAIDAEKTARVGWSRALQSARDIDADRDTIKSKVKQLEADRQIWKDTSKDVNMNSIIPVIHSCLLRANLLLISAPTINTECSYCTREQPMRHSGYFNSHTYRPQFH